MFPARSVSFTVSLAVAFSPRFSALAIFPAAFFLGFNLSVFAWRAASLIFFGRSL